MKKIVFIGDSITDMKRNRECSDHPSSYGFSHVFLTEAFLSTNYPHEYKLVNKGISGSRIVDVYARIKSDVWNENPDYVVVLIGINDIWHEIYNQNGVDIKRFINIYKMMIEETLERLPNVKFIVMEPFFLEGKETIENIDKFKEIYTYSDKIRIMCCERDIPFIPLQVKLDKLGKVNGNDYYLYDGVHPTVCGSQVISSSFLETFLKLENKTKGN